MSAQAAPSPRSERRRPRRIAADEAHAWARNLRLGNPYAKLVLSMLTLYVNPDGTCFVGIETLAEDCELSPDTVRKRLAWLEQVGAIARFPQWLDANGRRNGEGRGKRTSDEIRLLISADPEVIEAHAKGNGDGGSDAAVTEISPRSQQGLTNVEIEGQDLVSPPVALCQPSDSGKGLISEPEPELEESPLPPKGGETQHSPDFENRKAASWAEFETAWQEPILRQSIARQVWWALTEAEEPIAIKAAKGYVVYRRSQNKPPNVINAHTFLRERDAWVGFAAHAPLPPPPPSPPPRFISADSDEFKASCVLDVLRGEAPRLPIKIPEHGIGGMTRNPQTPLDVLCLAPFADVDRKTWFTMETETHRHQVGAWNERVKDWTGRELKGERLATGEFKELLGNKYPIYKTVFRVPCEWPPRKDGTWSTTGPPVAA